MRHKNLAVVLLRLGLALSFLYAAIASFLAPQNWIGFIPQFVDVFGIPDSFLLSMFSLAEIVLAAWLLWGRYLFLPALASAFLLGGITLFNPGALDILFRDLSLFFAALALLVLKE